MGANLAQPPRTKIALAISRLAVAAVAAVRPSRLRIEGHGCCRAASECEAKDGESDELLHGRTPSFHGVTLVQGREYARTPKELSYRMEIVGQNL